MLSPNGLRNRNAWVVGIFSVALLLRLSILALTFPGNDAVYYYDDAQIALNLIQGKGYSVNYQYRNWLLYEAVLKTAKLDNPVLDGTRATALKQPLHPLLLAGLFWTFGSKNFLVVFLLQAVMSSATASLLFLCLRQTAPFTALGASIGAAIYPAFAFHSVTAPESTTLTLLLIAASWFCLVKIRDGASRRLLALGATIGGLAVLTEPVTSIFFAIWCCYATFLDRSNLKHQLSTFAIATAVMLAVVSPWVARNYFVFERFPVIKSGSMGHIFNWGLHFSGKGSWISDERMVTLEKAGRSMSELEEEEAIQKELFSLFPSHWREYVTYDVPHHFLHLWWDVPRYWSNYSASYLLGRRIPYVLLLSLAVPSLLRTIVHLVRQPWPTLCEAIPQVAALALILTSTIPYSLVGAFHSRYRFPIELALFVFAGTTIEPVVRSAWQQRRCFLESEHLREQR